MKQIYIYGCSGHGLVVADIARACGYQTIIFVDDGKNQCPTFEEIQSLNTFPIALGVGDNVTRQKLFEKVCLYGFSVATLIHPSSTISPSATLEAGTVVMPHVVVNAGASVGKGVILNTGCIIEHECTVEDFVHISPRVALGGNITVGNLSHIGIGASVIQGMHIGAKTIIGAGSVVVEHMPEGKVCYGNPCKIMRENHDA